ncbi:riboflavin biosynthesis protein RibF [Winogradskyella sp. PC-19]|uniref:bifunctional riboflavin kinase/FAD synthetase n=1 Tax=unclassified Winogradskyella TaxID=2615021 RepID=UPI000B3BDED2|nr:MULTISPECIES: bifunctional riboflavin kinase/FAD synthetase [unclassified Winogradskyella]ARV09908.1 riboflavin biosynthesis protein RibF [Winogradskyella sp. PC-19]RZN84445.1 MAG: bifunctional riboflavin kinase/FAD synthetase [Winogradskyella sp.]
MSLNNGHFSKILTIGTFDGVHLGHQKILKKLKKLSQQKKLIPSVLTFFPHPRMVLQQNHSIKLINTISERRLLLEKFGVDLICVKTFTKEFANLSARDYVKGILIDELNTKHIVIGYDHHFGKNRSANIDDLIRFSKEFDFEIEQISAKDIEEVTVSSTKIRKALDQGNVALANSYLGYNYFLTGKVVRGHSIGRTIDFPTANIYIEEDYKLIPKDGVYIVKAKIDSIIVYGMMNIGHNPTIKNKPHSIEVHFFDFEKDLYGQQIVIEMLTRLRDEHKFENVEALKKQLKDDRKNALLYIDSLL